MEVDAEKASGQALLPQDKVDTCLQALEMAATDAEVFAALLLVNDATRVPPFSASIVSSANVLSSDTTWAFKTPAPAFLSQLVT